MSALTADADWILSARLDDGAIAHYPDRLHVNPYLGSFAALGLTRAFEVTGDTRYSDAAWDWLRWYQDHQDADGFVTDYNVTPDGTQTSTGDMDSTDSYAGMFLLAALRTWQATGDTARLTAIAGGIDGAVRAIEATQDTDGLTWAKPSWHVKYLMDQSEVYAGLRSAVDLAQVLDDSGLWQRATSGAHRMRVAVRALWNPGCCSYDWAVFDNGARQATDWSVMYPDAQQQAWAVAFGLVPQSRARDLMAKFDVAQPSWDDPGAVGYWPITGWAFTRVGNPRALTAADRIRTAAETAGLAWPYNTGVAGQLIRLA